MGIEQAVNQLIDQSAVHLTEFLLALSLLVAGLFVGWLLKYVAELLLRSLGLDGFAERSGLTRTLRQVSGMEQSPSQLSGKIVFWAVLLFFLASALETVGLQEIGGFVDGFARFLPRVLGAALLIMGGIFAGRLLREQMSDQRQPSPIPQTWQRLDEAIQIIVVAAAVLLALILLGLDLSPLLWVIVIGLALAGAIGTFSWGPVLRLRWHDQQMALCLRQQIKEGELVRIDQHEGFVIAIGQSYLTLQTAEGTIHLPYTFVSERPIAVMTDLAESGSPLDLS